MKKASTTTAVSKPAVTSGPPETVRGYTAQDHADRGLCRAWSGTVWRPGHSQESCRAVIAGLTGVDPIFTPTAEGGLRVAA